MDIAAGIARALKVDALSHEPTTGSDAQRQFAHMKARLVARYRLAAVSGRPEELVRPSTSRGVSLGYGCRTIRVRLMEGREWVDRADFQIKDDWQDRLDAMCDEWFDIEESNLGVPRPKEATMPTPASVFNRKNDITDRFQQR